MTAADVHAAAVSGAVCPECGQREYVDHRSWFRHHRTFETVIVVGTVLADEVDVAELGARVAVAYAHDAVDGTDQFPLLTYRRVS